MLFITDEAFKINLVKTSKNLIFYMKIYTMYVKDKRIEIKISNKFPPVKPIK